MTGVLLVLVHGPIMAAVALLLAGVLPWCRARLAGRVGSPVLQPWRDWRRLLRKNPVVAEGSSALVVLAPGIALSVTVLAALLVPSFTLGMATAPVGDLVVIVGLLALARAVTSLAAIDAGTAPAGLVAMRATRLGTLAEPVLVLVVFTIALLTGTTNLDAALLVLRETALPGVSLLLAVAGLAAAAVAVEAEVEPTAELSGWHAAAAEATLALRRVVWLSLMAALLLPGGLAQADAGVLDWLVGLVAWLLKLTVLAAACAVAGPIVQRAGQSTIGPMLGAALLLGLLAVLFLFARQGLT